jgi:hypothetical protein
MVVRMRLPPQTAIAGGCARKTYKLLTSDQPCISAAPAALDRYLAALPAMSLIHFAPFAEAGPRQASDKSPSARLIKNQ